MELQLNRSLELMLNMRRALARRVEGTGDALVLEPRVQEWPTADRASEQAPKAS